MNKFAQVIFLDKNIMSESYMTAVHIVQVLFAVFLNKYYKQGTKSIHIWHLSLDIEHLSLDIEHPTGIGSPFK